MSIDTAALLGFFALAGVGCVCVGWIITTAINARLRIEQEQTERAYHLREAERVRLEAARYDATIRHEQRAIAVINARETQQAREVLR